MNNPAWKIELQRQTFETRKMILKPGDPGPLPVTKVGGAPWWPESEARPKCWQGHRLAFMAQVALGDVGQLALAEQIAGDFRITGCSRAPLSFRAS